MMRLFYSFCILVTMATVLQCFIGAGEDRTEPAQDESEVQSDSAVDISTVAADLVVPAISEGQPAAGMRFRRTLAGEDQNEIYHVVYLPTDYPDVGQTGVGPTDVEQAGIEYPGPGTPEAEEVAGEVAFPLIVEFPGNRYTSPRGDVCTGLPDGCRLGYGISEGKGAVWLCLPFISSDGCNIATNWWGEPPEFAAAPTVEYAKRTLESICSEFSIDRERIFLTGFSRGAIACNFIGLHDDDIASIWSGFIPYSHYDGLRQWPYPGSDRISASARLQRLNGRPQFVCHENTDGRNGLSATRQWLEENGIPNCTFSETGFLNHNDAWVLRPSDARDQLRSWYANQVMMDDK